MDAANRRPGKTLIEVFDEEDDAIEAVANARYIRAEADHKAQLATMRANAHTITCPRCRAYKGARCVTEGGRVSRQPHRARFNKANVAGMPGVPKPPA